MDLKAPARIELQIDELVLHGFSPQERHAIAEAVQRELTLLFQSRGAPGAPQVSTERALVRAPQAQLAEGTGAKQTGAAIARSIYGGLSA